LRSSLQLFGPDIYNHQQWNLPSFLPECHSSICALVVQVASYYISVRRLGCETDWWLLFQGLHSKDRKILQSVLMRNDPVLISNTVTRLSLQCTVPLIKELVTLIHGKTVVWVIFWLC
jgi:hypothetical protein